MVEAQARGNNSGRLVLLLIAGIPVTVMLAATWLWYFVVNGELDLIGALGTSNKGELLQPPRRFDELPLVDPDGRSFTLASEEPSWRMLVPVPRDECDDVCERSLYLTRQIRIALGKEMPRVERFLLLSTPAGETRLSVAQLSSGDPAPPDFEALLERRHPALRWLRAPAPGVLRLLPELEASPDSWYLIDPNGWVILRYDSTIDYKDVISDLKFLLKNSNA